MTSGFSMESVLIDGSNKPVRLDVFGNIVGPLVYSYKQDSWQTKNSNQYAKVNIWIKLVKRKMASGISI